MDESELLQQLVSQAQSHPDRSTQRRIALTKLIGKIRQSQSLKRPDNRFNIPNYQDVYDEALNDACMEICRRIDSYNPEYPVMAWVNNILNYRIQDVYNKYQKRGITNLPKNQKPRWRELDRPINTDDKGTSRNLEIANPAPEDDESKLIRDFITEDPDRVLATKHIKNLPEATFQKILLMICEDKTWKEIAEYFGTSISTASSFYRRTLDELLEYLQQSLGY
jgi:RNA polymerase sigma factor (sigma-70 family)